jgi:hypothetical protein
LLLIQIVTQIPILVGIFFLEQIGAGILLLFLAWLPWGTGLSIKGALQAYKGESVSLQECVAMGLQKFFPTGCLMALLCVGLFKWAFLLAFIVGFLLVLLGLWALAGAVMVCIFIIPGGYLLLRLLAWVPVSFVVMIEENKDAVDAFDRGLNLTEKSALSIGFLFLSLLLVSGILAWALFISSVLGGSGNILAIWLGSILVILLCSTGSAVSYFALGVGNERLEQLTKVFD